MDRGAVAEKLFKEGYNCTVAVVCAFKDLIEARLGVKEAELKKLSIGFGGGLSRQRLVCGAVSGMTMVLSALLSDGEDKGGIYVIVQKACAEFKAETGSLICAELLKGPCASDTSPCPEKRTAEYYKKRPCAELCRLAAEIAQKFIEKQ